MEELSPTALRLVDAAEALVQRRGYNAFSYADLSKAVGIRKASVHHHFPSKGDLGRAVAERYRQAFAQALSRIDEETENPRGRLERYAELYAEALSQRGRMCLCGMLAAEYATLPPLVQEQVRGFFDDQRGWLTTTFRRAGHPRSVAVRRGEALLAGLEGALLVSRTNGDTAAFAQTARVLIDALA